MPLTKYIFRNYTYLELLSNNIVSVYRHTFLKLAYVHRPVFNCNKVASLQNLYSMYYGAIQISVTSYILNIIVDIEIIVTVSVTRID